MFVRRQGDGEVEEIQSVSRDLDGEADRRMAEVQEVKEGVKNGRGGILHTEHVNIMSPLQYVESVRSRQICNIEIHYPLILAGHIIHFCNHSVGFHSIEIQNLEEL